MMKRVALILCVLALACTPALFGLASAAAPNPHPTLWAVVDVNGSLAYGNGAVSSSQFGAQGEYSVVFNRDVSHCAYVAGSGDYTGDTYAGPDDGVTMGVAPQDGNVNAVFLVEYDTILLMDNYSSGFHLVVTC